MPAMRPLVRLLRSPRLAIGLILAVVALAVAATIVPQGDASRPEVLRWSAANPLSERVAGLAGLHHVFTSPVFLLIVLALAMSTAVCAFGRTTRAREAAASRSRLGQSELARLRGRTAFSLALPDGVDRDAVLRGTADVAQSRHMRVRSGAGVLEATSRRWGVWGSPVFHWSLTLLMVFFVAGYAARSEGAIDLRIDQPVREAPDAYRTLVAGPLFSGRYTGLQIEAGDVAPTLVIDGVERGPAPFVTILRGDVVVKSQRVYPNNTLRYGNLTVHMDGLAFALELSVEDSSGVSIGRVPFSIRNSVDQSGAVEPVDLTFRDAQQQRVMDARVMLHVPRDAWGHLLRAPDLIPATVQTSTPDSERWGPPVEMRLGDAIPMPGGRGTWLRWVALDDAVTVRVVNDWSVPFIYLLVTFTALGLTVALMVLSRRAVAIIDETEGGPVLRLLIDARREPAFRRELTDAVSVAVETACGPTPSAGTDG